MIKPWAQLRPHAKPFLVTVSWLLALTLLFIAACGGDEAPTSETMVTPTQPVAPTAQPTAAPQATPSPTATLAPEPTATVTVAPSPTDIPATAAPEPTATAAPTQIPAATATPEPAAVTVNNCGVETVYDAVPQRVVATDTSALEVLVALGLQEHVIGYFGGTPDRLQPQHQARAAVVERLGGSFPYPSLEAVLAPGPDLVFSYGFNESAGLTGQNLRDSGAHSFSFTEACPDFTGKVTLEVMFEDVRAVAQIFGVERRAEELIASVGAADRRCRGGDPGRRTSPSFLFRLRRRGSVHGALGLRDVGHHQPRRRDEHPLGGERHLGHRGVGSHRRGRPGVDHLRRLRLRRP